MTLTRNQKIGIGIGAGLVIGLVIYFGFIKKSESAVTELAQDPTKTGGTSGGVGGSPAGAPPRNTKPGTTISGKEGAIIASQGRG